MTIELNGITTDSTASTVLDYGFNTNPNPLQISSTGSISITVSKADPPTVQCTSLVFRVSVGDAAADLTTNPSHISTQCPSDWSATADGTGTFTFTYLGNSEIGRDGLLFVLSNIAVNDQVGTTSLSITENLQSGTNDGSHPLAKFPDNFTVSDLTADSYNISPGGTVNLSWNGSAGGNYSLSYDGEPDGKPVSVLHVGTYPVDNLQETTTFTLTVTAEGDTIQLVRQCIVTVGQPEIGEFGIVGNPTKVLIGSSFLLYWQTVNADHCSLSINGVPTNSNLSANMSESPGYPVIAPPTPGTYSYALTAIGEGGGGGPSSSLTISVNAEILTFGIVGNPSEAGTGTTIKLYWSTQGATLCSLALNGTTVASNLPANVDPSQGYAFTLPAKTGTASFVLSTYYNQQSVGSSNPVSLSVIFQFDLVPIALPNRMYPVDMRVSPDGSLLGGAGDKLAIISTANNQTIQTIDYRSNDASFMMYSTFNHDGTQAYGIVYPIFGSDSYSIESFDCSSGQRLSQSPAACYMNMVRCSSASTDMLVAATAPKSEIPDMGRPFPLSSLCLLDPSNLSVVKSVSTIPPAYPHAMTFFSMAANPQGDQVLICAFANGSTGLYSYQLSSDTFPASPLFTTELAFAPSVVVFSTDGSRYFIANTTDPEIHVVDTSQNQVIGKITLPAPLSNTAPIVYAIKSPMVAAPDGINFFALLNNQTIAWIKLDSMKVVLCSPVPSAAFAIATVKNSTGLYLYMLADGLGMCEVPDLAQSQ